jgi:hypothetical protein
MVRAKKLCFLKDVLVSDAVSEAEEIVGLTYVKYFHRSKIL